MSGTGVGRQFLCRHGKCCLKRRQLSGSVVERMGGGRLAWGVAVWEVVGERTETVRQQPTRNGWALLLKLRHRWRIGTQVSDLKGKQLLTKANQKGAPKERTDEMQHWR